MKCGIVDADEAPFNATAAGLTDCPDRAQGPRYFICKTKKERKWIYILSEGQNIRCILVLGSLKRTPRLDLILAVGCSSATLAPLECRHLVFRPAGEILQMNNIKYARNGIHAKHCF